MADLTKQQQWFCRMCGYGAPGSDGTPTGAPTCPHCRIIMVLTPVAPLTSKNRTVYLSLLGEYKQSHAVTAVDALALARFVEWLDSGSPAVCHCGESYAKHGDDLCRCRQSAPETNKDPWPICPDCGKRCSATAPLSEETAAPETAEDSYMLTLPPKSEITELLSKLRAADIHPGSMCDEETLEETVELLSRLVGGSPMETGKDVLICPNSLKGYAGQPCPRCGDGPCPVVNGGAD